MQITLRIPDFNMHGFMKEWNKIIKKAQRLKLPEPSLFHGDRKDEKVFPEQENSPFVRMQYITIDNTSPSLDGWTFIGRLSHSKDHDNILRSIPGESIPERYRNAGPNCEHCKWDRRRNHTFIIREDSTGALKQVGSTCIQDFFGGRNVAGILYAFELLDKVEERLSSYTRYDPNRFCIPTVGPSLPTYVMDLNRYVAVVAACVRFYGWVSRKEEYGSNKVSTAARAYRHDYNHIVHGDCDIVEPEDIEIANRAIDWARSISLTEPNEYLRNLRSACSHQTVAWGQRGVVASVVTAYQRAQKQIVDQAMSATSNHVGTPGDRIEETFEVIYERFSHSGLVIYGFRDQQGNEFTWFTGETRDELKIGNVVTLRGRIRRHDEYKGIKKTVLGRCYVVQLESVGV